MYVPPPPLPSSSSSSCGRCGRGISSPSESAYQIEEKRRKVRKQSIFPSSSFPSLPPSLPTYLHVLQEKLTPLPCLFQRPFLLFTQSTIKQAVLL